MRLFLIGDIHLPAADPEAARQLAAALQDMRRTDPEATLVTLGDNSLSGRPEEMEAFFHVLDENAPERAFVILGNHDVRGPDPSQWNRSEERESVFWPGARERYLRLSRRYRTGEELSFFVDDGDSRLIFLNTENGLKDAISLPAGRLHWLRERLSEGAAAGQKLFVFAHQALNDTHWHANLYGGFGEQDGAIKQLLTGFPQTVFICGHIHNGFGMVEAVDRPFGTQVEIPSFCIPGNGLTRPGTGYHLETAQGEIRLKARDFLAGEWMPQYDLRLPVPGLPEWAARLRARAPQGEQSRLLEEADRWLRLQYEPYDRDDEEGLPQAPLFHRGAREQIRLLCERIKETIEES